MPSANPSTDLIGFAKELTDLSRKYGVWFNDEPSVVEGRHLGSMSYAFDEDQKLILQMPEGADAPNVVRISNR